MKKSYKKFLCDQLVFLSHYAVNDDNFDEFCRDIFPMIIKLIRREVEREKVEQKNKN